MSNKYVNDDGLEYLIQTIKDYLSTKVDKISGKGLSTNDFTNADKSYLYNSDIIKDLGTFNFSEGDSLQSIINLIGGKAGIYKIKVSNTAYNDVSNGIMLVTATIFRDDPSVVDMDYSMGVYQFNLGDSSYIVKHRPSDTSEWVTEEILNGVTYDMIMSIMEPLETLGPMNERISVLEGQLEDLEVLLGGI